MHWYKDSLEITTRGKGLYPFTQAVSARIRDWGIQEGMCYLFLPHTSASLIINESYDPTARTDLETFLEKLVPEDQPWYRHKLEGPDDTTSHLKAMLTQTSLTIPIDNGSLSLGTWQGVYLCEHRTRSQRRQVLLRCLQAA
ncbi:MAG TPA: secondary thiamine-phosphate synthase enzyme YjbQ [Anaerolineales bacterium]|nr:secondary thiamine-phosphate synthase enzyme YjbQ [Anaerolineales bacterium]